MQVCRRGERFYIERLWASPSGQSPIDERQGHWFEAPRQAKHGNSRVSVEFASIHLDGLRRSGNRLGRAGTFSGKQGNEVPGAVRAADGNAVPAIFAFSVD